MVPSIKRVYEFGSFQLDAQRRLLLREGEAVQLPSKSFDMLLLLVENGGRVIDKDELLERVWPDTVVEENNLTVNMSALRKALGETRGANRYIATVPGRGYQFVATVSEIGDEPEDLIIERQSISRVVIEEKDESADRQPEVGYLLNAEPRLLPAAPPGPGRLPGRRRWLIAGAVVLALAVAASLLFFYRPRPIESVAAVKSMAVLPFMSLNAEAGDEYLGLGLTDALITKLSNIRPVIVRPTSAVLKYVNAKQEPLAAGREMNVDALLEGSIQHDGERVRITVQLVRVSDGAPLWAESFDEQFTNLFAAQTAISERVVRALTLKLTSEQQRQIGKHYTENAEAFQAYIKGRYFWNRRSPDSFRKALAYFQQAIEIDPTYALAYAGVADCYIVLGTPQSIAGGTPDRDAYKKARAAALEALRLDDTLAEAHASLAATLSNEDDEAAHREYERAIELNPNYATTYSFYAMDLLGDARPDEAIKMSERAFEIDPLSPPVNTTYGIVLFRLRRYDEAIEQFRKTLEINPDHARAHWGLGLAYEQKGMYTEAISELQRSLALSGGSPVTLSSLAHVYGVSGRRKEAQEALKQLLDLHAKHLVLAYYVAAAYAGLGEKQPALAWLENHPGELFVGLLQLDQQFDGLRDEPRFQALLARRGLQPRAAADKK
jgi:DNA-binding winged helix-turn-helix (wHTH) protein/tetratricopeptide (TPR) repeat protein